MTLEVKDGIGWKPDPDSPGRLVSADIIDYVNEIERLKADNKRLRLDLRDVIIQRDAAMSCADRFFTQER